MFTVTGVAAFTLYFRGGMITFTGSYSGLDLSMTAKAFSI